MVYMLYNQPPFALMTRADGPIRTDSLDQLARYVQVGSFEGAKVAIKVDDNGLSGFAAPGYQMVLSGAQVASDLSELINLERLVNQRVLLV